MRRGASGLCGVLAIDKPYGVTSHDVVNRIRSVTGERRVGHAGTLDPAATGLMFVGVGAATRLTEYLTGHDKEYEARIAFGIATDTDDAQGRVLHAADASHLASLMAQVDADEVLSRFTGEIEQLPPAYSAIKKNGVVAYKAAREGSSLELEPRAVVVREARLEGTGVQHASIPDGAGGIVECELPYWDVRFSVSKGTYIRALARDMGAYLGCGAHLGALRRTAVAQVSLDDACTLDDLEACASRGEDFPWCDPSSLLGFPVVELDAAQARCVENGRSLSDVVGVPEGMVSCVREHRLLAVYSMAAGVCRPATVIPGGVVGAI